MRGTEITVEILTLSLSKGGDFGPAAYFATVPIEGKQDFSLLPLDGEAVAEGD
jgi:hypothetical protein